MSGAASIRGVAPRSIASPRDANELSEVVKAAARDKLCIAVTGGGTKLSLGFPPEQLDLLVRTREMKKILEYAPADMVLIAEAGATLAELQAVAREHRQQLALDPPYTNSATIGGIIATGDSGPGRMRYGAVKDLIIGATLIRADGALARSGGKVVKNVAGFDLPKLVCGSLGTLATIATATFRLHPLPELVSTILLRGLSAAALHQQILKVREAQLEPSAAVALRGETSWQLALRFEGFAPGVREQCARLTLSGAYEILTDEAASQLWSRHGQLREEGALRLKISYLPSRFAELESDLLRLGEGWALYPSLGVGYYSGAAVEPVAVESARASLLRSGGSLIVQAMPDSLAIDPWGPASGSFALMRQLKQTFDPERRLNRGRFLGQL